MQDDWLLARGSPQFCYFVFKVFFPQALQLVLKWKMKGDERTAVELLSIVNEMLDQKDFY